MERIVNFIKNLLNSKGNISSKRFCGFIGWMIVIGITIYCTTSNLQAPHLSYDLLYVSAALLGLDSIMNGFNKK